MNESGGGMKLPSTACDTKSIIDRVYKAANMLQVVKCAHFLKHCNLSYVLTACVRCPGQFQHFNLLVRLSLAAA